MMRFQLVGLVVIAVIALGGCKRWQNKMEAGRQALIDSATPCPAPATCTGSMTVSQHTVSTCSAPPSAGKRYAVGDTVVVKETFPTLGRVTMVKATSYEIEWAEGISNERPADAIIAQVCH